MPGNKRREEIFELINQVKSIYFDHDTENMNALYFAVGNFILQMEAKWRPGEPLLPWLQYNLQNGCKEIAGIKNITIPQLQQMRKVAGAYRDIDSPLLKKAFLKLSWTHHVKLLGKITDPSVWPFYLWRACECGWGCQEMVRQIDQGLHRRAENMNTNLAGKLSPEDDEIAMYSLNNKVEFHLPSPELIVRERDLTASLKKNIPDFLEALGSGFAYVKDQCRQIGYIFDFVLHHRQLDCYFIVEIKMRKFKPEDTGKMINYLECADKDFKGRNKCIGLILCPSIDDKEVRDSLKNSNRPIAVATFEIAGQSMQSNDQIRRPLLRRQLSQTPHSVASLSPK